MTLRLSILDQSPIPEGGTAADAVAATLDLARRAEALGYHRYWVAEHHNTRAFAGSCPEILLARLAAETSRIRLGSGGVMLTHYSPLKVAEQFRMLETLAPGRIDLGLGRAPGADGRTNAALQGGPQGWSLENYPHLVDLVRRYLADARGDEGFEDGHPYRGIHAVPRGPGMPEMWLLGSSPDSAVYAALLGLRFCYAHFIAGEDGAGGLSGEQILAVYRERFQPSAELQAPHAAIAVSCLTAATREDARRLSASRDLWVLRLLSGEHTAFPPTEDALETLKGLGDDPRLAAIRARAFVGAPGDVLDQLQSTAGRYAAQDVVTLTITYDPADRARSAQLLMQALEARQAA